MTKRRAGVMILTLVVLAAVTALLASAVARENAEVRSTITRLELRRARLAAESGVQRALALFLAQDPNLVSQQDDWFQFGNESADRFLIGNDSFRIQVVDASSRVNLNTAPESDLQNLGLSTEQIDSLLDWREEGTTPRTEGAKDEYYNSLANPYNAALRRLSTLDELLLIKGFDPNSLIQVPETSNTSGVTPRPLYSLATVDSFAPNTDAQGQQKQNLNQAQVGQLVQRGIPIQVAAAIIARRNQVGGQFTSFAQVLTVNGMTNEAAGAIVDGFSLTGAPRSEGLINVNTATADVLMSVTGMTSDVADAIISRQSAGITALSELLQVPGFTVQLLAATADRLTTKSETFLVRVIGQSGTSQTALEAVISINGGTPKIVKVMDTPVRDMRALWGWPDEATNDVDAGTGR